jgi:hypothetical protein
VKSHKNLSIELLREPGKSQTDWERVKNLTDSEIDFSDLPELEEESFKLAKVTRRESQLYNRIKINRLAELPKMTAQLMVQPSYLMTDQIIPQSLGGSDDLNNLALACHRCNFKPMLY